MSNDGLCAFDAILELKLPTGMKNIVESGLVTAVVSRSSDFTVELLIRLICLLATKNTEILVQTRMNKVTEKREIKAYENTSWYDVRQKCPRNIKMNVTNHGMTIRGATVNHLVLEYANGYLMAIMRSIAREASIIKVVNSNE